MSTQAGTPYLLGRVASRAGLGVWRNRGGVLVAAILAVAVGGYAALTWNGQTPLSLVNGVGVGVGAPSAAADGDCADTAIAALADKSTASAQRAYQCMDTGFQQQIGRASCRERV